MEEQVNKLIEKIENDSVQYYDYSEVCDMLKDLLINNQHFFYCKSKQVKCKDICKFCKQI